MSVAFFSRAGIPILLLALTTGAGADIKLFEVPTPNSYPESVAIGPDGNVWFTQKQGNKIGRLASEGKISEFPIPTADSRPQTIVAGPDGNLWFTEYRGNKLGRITPSGGIAEYPIATPESFPYGIAAGPDSALWFTLAGTNRIGRISVSGEMKEFALKSTRKPYGITAGPDGNLWFTGFDSNTIGRISPAGEVSEFPIPTPDSAPLEIAVGPDGALWFTQSAADSIGRISPDGRISEFPVANAKSLYGIARSKDSMWISQHTGGILNRISAAGAITAEVKVENTRILNGIAIGPDGSVWFTAPRANSVGRYQQTHPELRGRTLSQAEAVAVGRQVFGNLLSN